jgi:hypothetical protein
MRPFRRCYHQIISILIRNGDIVRTRATILFAAGVVRGAPFVEAVGKTICQGYMHSVIPVSEVYIYGCGDNFIIFQDNLGVISSVTQNRLRSRSNLRTACGCELRSVLSACCRGITPSSTLMQDFARGARPPSAAGTSVVTGRRWPQPLRALRSCRGRPKARWQYR